MAESKKISGLPETTSPSTTGVTVVVQDGVTYKAKLSNFRGAIASGATETSEGVARLATYTETSGGTDNTTIVTPAKLKYYVDLFHETIGETTFIDSGITYTVIGYTGQTRSVFIDYTLVRGTGYQTGTIQILYDGTSVHYLDSFIDNDGGGLGVTLSADINSGEIRLVATTTSTGDDATFKGNIRRITI